MLPFHRNRISLAQLCKTDARQAFIGSVCNFETQLRRSGAVLYHRELMFGLLWRCC